MEEETFRPQRGGNAEDMARAQEFRQSVAAEIGESAETPTTTKFTGKMPPALRQMIEKDQPASRQLGQKKTQTSRQSNDVFNKNTKVQDLIAGLTSPQKYEKVQLPSRGVLYNGDDGPTDGIVHIRPMTGEEEQILATPRHVKSGKAINMIFDRCIQERINSERLLTADRTYLLVYLRIISYSHEYDVEVDCPNCNAHFNHTINLSNDIMVDFCPDDFDVSSFSAKLPDSNYEFTYRLSTGVDELDIENYKKQRQKQGFSDDTLIYRMATQIENIEGLTETAEISQLLRHMSTIDLNFIRNLIDDPPFGIKSGIPIICDNCGYDFEMNIPLESNFFSPKARKKEPTEIPV